MKNRGPSVGVNVDEVHGKLDHKGDHGHHEDRILKGKQDHHRWRAAPRLGTTTIKSMKSTRLVLGLK